MPSELENAALRFRASLLAQERAAAGEMVRAYAESWRRISTELAQIEAQIAAATAAGMAPDVFQPRLPGGPVIDRSPNTFSPSWLYRRSRLQALLRQVEAELRRFAELAAELTEAGQRLAVEAAQANAMALLEEAAGGDNLLLSTFQRLPKSALESFVGFSSNGSPLRALFDSLGTEASQGVQELLRSGILMGKGPRETARLMRRQYGMSLSRALTIARTEQLRAYREASRQVFEANDDVLAGWQWLSGANARTCPSCWAMHGTLHPVSESMDSHPNCRCTQVPVLKEMPLLVKPGEELFRALPESMQRRILGRSTWAAWQDGAMSFGDLVGVKNDPRWGRTHYAKSLREILGAEAAQRYTDMTAVAAMNDRAKVREEAARAKKEAKALAKTP